MKRLSIITSAGAIALMLSGCEATHLAYVSETTIGLDVALSSQSTGRVVFGYDRNNFALVPRKGDGQDAMSLVSTSCVFAHGIDDTRFNHFIASGAVAKNVAKSKPALITINSALFGGGDEKCD